MREAILSRPWLFILAGYLLGICALATMVTIALRHQDKPIAIHGAAADP